MAKILIVEDELSIAELEKDYLERAGHEVVIETTGDGGLKTALEKDIDRFLDVYEPETDGEKIYQQAVRDGQIIEEFDSEIINEEVYDENNNQN